MPCATAAAAAAPAAPPAGPAAAALAAAAAGGRGRRPSSAARTPRQPRTLGGGRRSFFHSFFLSAQDTQVHTRMHSSSPLGSRLPGCCLALAAQSPQGGHGARAAALPTGQQGFRDPTVRAALVQQPHAQQSRSLSEVSNKAAATAAAHQCRFRAAFAGWLPLPPSPRHASCCRPPSTTHPPTKRFGTFRAYASTRLMTHMAAWAAAAPTCTSGETSSSGKDEGYVAGRCRKSAREAVASHEARRCAASASSAASVVGWCSSDRYLGRLGRLGGRLAGWLGGWGG